MVLSLMRMASQPPGTMLALIGAALLGVAVLGATASCDSNGTTRRAPTSPAGSGTLLPARDPSTLPATSAASGARGRRRTNCEAPSARTAGPIDGREPAALETCPVLRTGQEHLASRCGEGEPEPQLQLVRLDEAVLAMDEPTRQHVLEIGRRGRALGRNPRAFGMIGDSMTVSGAFMRAFAAGKTDHALAPELVPTLRTTVAGDPNRTIIDYYRGVQAQRVRGHWCDSFGAPKAARVGARAGWALTGDDEHPAPLVLLVESLSPAVAVVLFGGNDAAYRLAAPDQIADDFERDFTRVLDALESRGVIAIVSTIARHGSQPGLPDCGRSPTELSNWRLAVQTNAVNARIALLACRRHLPLVDLRFALDGVVNRGLDRDGVHPSWFRPGSGQLTPRGLQCGYTVRNYLTLRMLAQVKELLCENGVWPG